MRVAEMRGLVEGAEREGRDLNDGERTRLQPNGEGAEQRSWGEQAIAAPELRAFIQGGCRGRARIELRAVHSLGTIVQPDRQEGIIGLPRRSVRTRIAFGASNGAAKTGSGACPAGAR